MSPAATAGDGALGRLGDYLREHRGGIVTDLLFAVARATLANAPFRVVDGPTWAYHPSWPPASSLTAVPLSLAAVAARDG